MKIRLEQTDSTNRIAKDQVNKGLPSGSVVWATSQSGGKGQYERSFSSPQGGLYFSLLLKPDLPPADLPLITLATGLACRDVLSDHCHVEAMIKWPNDLYLAGKKIGGILCENIFDTTCRPPVSTVIIGVGLNINSSLLDFPVDLHTILTTVHEQTRVLHDLEPLLDFCVIHIQRMVEALHSEKDGLLHRWQSYDYLFDRRLCYVNGSETVLGTGKGIASDGRYQLIDQYGQERLILGGQLRPDDSTDHPGPI